jgi:hypothetical protein
VFNDFKVNKLYKFSRKGNLKNFSIFFVLKDEKRFDTDTVYYDILTERGLAILRVNISDGWYVIADNSSSFSFSPFKAICRNYILNLELIKNSQSSLIWIDLFQ